MLNKIGEELETENFCKADFEITESEKKGSIIKITFKAKPEYYFEIIETTIRKKRIDRSPFSTISGLTQEYEEEENATLTIESPGNYKVIESHQASDLDSAIDRIEYWTINIRDELIAPDQDKENDIEDNLAWLQNQVDKEIENPDEKFSDDEITHLNKKLDNLKNRIEELETKLGGDESINIAAQETIQKTKDDLNFYPKGIWYKTAGNKLINLMKSIIKTQEGRQVIAETVKNLLK